MQVVVTGASGFIGSHLVDSLLDAGYNVRAVARRLPGLISTSALQILDCRSIVLILKIALI